MVILVVIFVVALLFVVRIVAEIFHSFLVLRFRAGAETGLPIFLDCGWEFVHMREEHCDLPHVGRGESLVPSGHAGVTDASANGVEDVPLGIVRWIGDQIRRRRIKGVGERGGLALEASMAQGAIHSVELHTVDQVLIVGHEGIGYAWGVTVHGGIDGSHGKVTFKVGRLDICGCGEQTQGCDAERDENECNQGDEDAQKKFAHETSGDILAERWAGAPVRTENRPYKRVMKRESVTEIVNDSASPSSKLAPGSRCRGRLE